MRVVFAGAEVKAKKTQRLRLGAGRYWIFKRWIT